MGGKKFKQNLGWAAESARDSSLVSKTLTDLLCHGFVFVTDSFIIRNGYACTEVIEKDVQDSCPICTAGSE